MALVLVVEDEYAIARLLEDVLTDEGHRVAVAGNGKQALQLAALEIPQLVLTDFMMPVMDGASLIGAMAADARLKDVPVIIMSSMPQEAVAERCSGYVQFVRKPFRIFDLIDVVARLTSST
jgi:CheY-like chemotaxis protein